MVLVDTSVWIDFFAGRASPHIDTLEQFINQGEDLVLCGIILTEILQGIADDVTYRRVRQFMKPLPLLPMTVTVFIEAAEIYRTLRKKGITIRKTNDCIIAATVLEHNCRLLHRDKDFSFIAKKYPLRTV